MRARRGHRALRKKVSRERALSYVLGYTCADDVSARDWQKRLGGGQWCRGKTFDSFAPLGPHVVTADEIPDPGALRISTVINGERLQDSTTADMIFDVQRLIEFLSGSTTLPPGTVILTGTPSGVGMSAPNGQVGIGGEHRVQRAALSSRRLALVDAVNSLFTLLPGGSGRSPWGCRISLRSSLA
jgi:2-keto-4-pentenoate hydratase/2-oxohepta-3-ene-1,7-dioic acid hydratase in catechol pathway